MIDLFQTIKDWSHQRHLKKHGCTTQKEYDKKFDLDYSASGDDIIRECYHGYSYVYCFNNHMHRVYDWTDNDFGLWDIEEWCEINCQGKWRIDWQRAIQNYWGRWEQNGIGGGDYYFIAFKNSIDYSKFLLRWG